MKKNNRIRIVAGVRKVTLGDLFNENETPIKNKVIVIQGQFGLFSYKISEDTDLRNIRELLDIYYFGLGYAICGQGEKPEFNVDLPLKPADWSDVYNNENLENVLKGRLIYLKEPEVVRGPTQLEPYMSCKAEMRQQLKEGLIYVPTPHRIINIYND
ncbi:hypothetical protein SAMN05216480_10511 [Pustulibacterium marinum]|uniref:Uncharacterized protein n=1 Tax=Pustulibacterium marinum TaxID=1224947 RepID=A0A1I7GK55_9FLAO|nr:hypothetical protein [Pustulibacterium marinum]SFU48711.1 hypothetical protein SAMN05216480_10511 [Pustulibacterium marinum]